MADVAPTAPAKRRRVAAPAPDGSEPVARRKPGPSPARLSRFGSPEALAADLVVEVLAHADLFTLLSLSRTNKSWHGILSSKVTGRPSASDMRIARTDPRQSGSARSRRPMRMVYLACLRMPA